MNAIFNLLKKPHPYFRKKWLVVVITTVWIFLVVAVLQPFGLQYHPQKPWVVFYFTFTSFLSSSIVTYLFPILFKNHFIRDKWTLGKYFLFSISIVLIMALFTIIYVYFVLMEEFSSPRMKFPGLSEVIIMCLMCGLLPTVIIYFVEEQLEIRAKWEALRKQSHNQELSDEIESGDKVTLHGKTKESISFVPDNFLYAEVIKNYVTICFIKKEKIVSKPIRSTLAHIMGEMQDYPQIIQCHRAFLINSAQIVRMEKTPAGGGQLVLKSLDTPIPVSRTYIKQIEEVLAVSNEL